MAENSHPCLPADAPCVSGARHARLEGAINRSVVGAAFGVLHAVTLFGLFLILASFRHDEPSAYFQELSPFDSLVVFGGGPIVAGLVGMLLLGALGMTAGDQRGLSGKWNGAFAGAAGAILAGTAAFVLLLRIFEIDQGEQINNESRLMIFVGLTGGLGAFAAWTWDRVMVRFQGAGPAWRGRGLGLAVAGVLYVIAALGIHGAAGLGTDLLFWVIIALVMAVPGALAGAVLGSRLFERWAWFEYVPWIVPASGICFLAILWTFPQTQKPYEGKSIRYWQNQLNKTDPRAVEVLTEMLGDRNAETRLWAAHLLVHSQHLKTEQVRGILLEGLRASDPVSRQVALQSLTWDDSDVVTEAIVELLKDDDAKVREEAYRALCHRRRLGPCARALATTLRDGRTRRWALLVFRNSEAESTKDAIPILIAYLGDEDPEICSAAANALGMIGPTAMDAVAELRRLRDDAADPACRDAASAALGRITVPAPPDAAQK